MKSLRLSLAFTGAAFLTAVLVVVITRAPLGSPLFLICVGVTAVAYILMLARVWNEDAAPPGLLLAAFALALAFRVPLAIPQAGPDSDMVRYVWDGHVQQLGYNPYLVLPSDPAMAATHTAETRLMPSLRARTPYPPGAQLFFRLIVALHDSSRAMKLALVACDLLTIVVLWRWLVLTGRPAWLALAYAWNPLVIFEIAHSGHIDALGALWITASAYWLARRRTALASIAFVLAVATKLLPVVLVPLFWRRVRLRDALAAATLLLLLYLPFISGPTLPFGAVPNVVAHIRFNGPLFRVIAGSATPQLAAAAAVAVGLAVACWSRLRLPPESPAAWAWPMAAALACAPVIYPWYLLYFTPFLFTTATLPLTAWTLTIMPVYVVWDVARHGGRWVVPTGLMAAEYGLPCALLAWGSIRHRRREVRAQMDVAPRPLNSGP
ncbi:MAG: alpha,6-mannosyltransferase [Acidobacteriota bacterium]